MAISTPRIESIPRFELGPEVSNPYPITIGSPGFTTTTSDAASVCSGVAGADVAGPVVVGADVAGPVVGEVVSSVSPAPQADIATAIIAMTSKSDNSLLISFHSFLKHIERNQKTSGEKILLFSFRCSVLHSCATNYEEYRGKK
jgi:hypothetical protein